MNDEIVDLLRQVRDELRTLPAAIAAVMSCAPAPQDLRDDEHSELAFLAGSISASIGDRAFNLAELIKHCAFDPALKAALTRAAGGFDSHIARRLGKRLQRAQGYVLQGYKVERVKTERAGALWRVVAISRLSLPRHLRSVDGVNRDS